MNSSLRFFLVIVLLPLALTYCSSTHQNQTILSNAFNANRMGKHIEYLASDSFLGRKPFTLGETRTINYLQQEFSAIGVEPGNSGSFLQKVPLVRITSIASPQMKVQSAEGSFYLQGPDDYVIWSNSTDAKVEMNQDELVFAGYGIVAPEYNWNDYQEINVKDKIVMVLINEPIFKGQDSSLFKGDTMTYYARWTYKVEEAARQGAKGCLIIHSLKGTGQDFKLIKNGWNGTRLRLDERKQKINTCTIAGWVTEEAAQKIMRRSAVKNLMLSDADRIGFRGKPLQINLSASILTRSEYKESNNVIAKIEGSKWPDEYIIYTAHWDHLGIGIPDDKGDSIYNGAHDNASGVAGLLELANAFKNLPKPPKRTIIFLALTAEEQGLWGSDWYVHNPVYPINKTLANINIDGLNPFEKTTDMIIVGQPQSRLEDYLKEEASKMGRTVAYDGAPGAGYYFRSDQFNFAKVGIPAIYAGSGSNVDGKEPGYGKKWKDEYGKNKYHRPSDEYDSSTWTMEAAIEDLKLLFNLGKKIAEGKNWPQWRINSEFKLARK